eukprot:CAMPEP_0172906624 /NCGR_PEP_ID=MMETSP1075-20121228/177266_1 /TAXON_ID=2916 /ORGANISM="Ceratium fusus, Strain PA161109" /LENGTH=68 /DNA_ID=CAMNT_0013764097 /DNA_START=37 /DNA_END=240 /DNA_ORIENTATION=+
MQPMLNEISETGSMPRAGGQWMRPHLGGGPLRRSSAAERGGTCRMPVKTNPLHGRWITVTGGQSAFIK